MTHLDYFQELKRCFLLCFVFFFTANLCGRNDKHFPFSRLSCTSVTKPILDICHALRKEQWKYFFSRDSRSPTRRCVLIKTRHFLLELAEFWLNFSANRIQILYSCGAWLINLVFSLVVLNKTKFKIQKTIPKEQSILRSGRPNLRERFGR